MSRSETFGFDSDEIEHLPPTFVAYAADILGATSGGLSGGQIVSLMRAYAMEYSVQIPYGLTISGAPNKRTALLENLLEFNATQQHRIIRELCGHVNRYGLESDDIRQLRIKLATDYKRYDADTGASTINDALIEETRHWLDACPQALSLYNGAIGKFRAGVFERNVLDDLRLALEILLRSTFRNERSLENQLSGLGSFIKDAGGSPELGNMFQKLVEYYTKYQNSYVKHADNVIEQEIEFIIEITSAFMKHIARMSGKAP
jgi:hypothetical protein